MKNISFMAQKVKRTFCVVVSTHEVLGNMKGNVRCSSSTALGSSSCSHRHSCGSVRFHPYSALHTCAYSGSPNLAK
jgi:hypothetical protein